MRVQRLLVVRCTLTAALVAAAAGAAAQGQNRPPVLGPLINRSVAGGSTLTFSVSATDPDGDAITMTAAGMPTGARFTDSGTGTATFTWTPGRLDAGNYPITFTATDVHGASDSGLIAIIITNVNNAPVLAPFGPFTVNQGDLLTFSIMATDIDRDPLTYTLGQGPTGVNLSGGGTFSWTPGLGQVGVHPLGVRVSDGAAVDSHATTITVLAVQHPPAIQIAAGPHFAEVNLPFELQVSGTDPNGDVLRYTVVTGPDGAALDQVSGLFEWTPTVDQIGRHDVTFEVFDGFAVDSGTAVVVVTGGSPPVFDPLPPIVTRVGTPIRFDVIARDPSPTDRVSLAVNGLPDGARFTATTSGNPARGDFSWDDPRAGAYSVRFVADDGHNSASIEALIRVQVPSPDTSTPDAGHSSDAGQSSDSGQSADVPTPAGPMSADAPSDEHLAIAESGCGCGVTSSPPDHDWLPLGLFGLLGLLLLRTRHRVLARTPGLRLRGVARESA